MGDRQARIRHCEVAPTVLFVSDRVDLRLTLLGARVPTEAELLTSYPPTSVALLGIVNACGMQDTEQGSLCTGSTLGPEYS